MEEHIPATFRHVLTLPRTFLLFLGVPLAMVQHRGQGIAKARDQGYSDVVLETSVIQQGPDVLITSGRGYACVFPQDADSPIWIPDRLVRPTEGQAAQKEEVAKAAEAAGDSDKENETTVFADKKNHLDEDQAPDERSKNLAETARKTPNS
ncbi:putative N-acetyltransferase CML2-like protein [Cricetulus griseus]|uniref:Putative N-acetyltransferase CML2-like protein n=1 Tax=Cricetulus griseus TaxID=10029 RepID=A0A061HWT7_CRIGR|nr:putative N-acetyltransferase CML2-like protein [Cricetulus griseus]